MKLKDFRTFFNKELSDLYPKTEIDAFFFRLIEDKLNFQVTDVFTKPDFLISEEHLAFMNKVLYRLQKEEPIQYILGTINFYGLDFKVTKDVLIPRPETEELVSWVLEELKNRKEEVSILDIGTGSGCIPISIKKNTELTKISAIDVSKEALTIAKENAKVNGATINFITQDILQTDSLPQKYDIIISNPPYVRELEKEEMQNNVLQNEPNLALFVTNDDPLLFYNKIGDLAKNHLTNNGVLFFEINQYLGKETKALLEKKGFYDVTLKKDLFGNDRMIKALYTF